MCVKHKSSTRVSSADEDPGTTDQSLHVEHLKYVCFSDERLQLIFHRCKSSEARSETVTRPFLSYTLLVQCLTSAINVIFSLLMLISVG